MTLNPMQRLTRLYQEYVNSQVGPCDVTLIRWVERIETFGHFQVARRGWSYERAGELIDEARALLRQWRLGMPIWVVEIPQPDGTEISRQVQAPTYAQAVQLFD